MKKLKIKTRIIKSLMEVEIPSGTKCGGWVVSLSYISESQHISVLTTCTFMSQQIWTIESSF